MSSRELRVNLSTGFPILVQRFFVLANAGLLVALVLLIWPYLASAFYLYQGRNILESALREQGLGSSDWEIITFTPPNLYSSGLQAKLDSSAGYLRRAVRWDATNAEAYNAMAKVHYLQGDLLLAIDTLSKVNKLRPHDPLIHLTIGDIYDGLGLAEQAIAQYERSQMELRGTSVGERAEVNYLKLADAYLNAGDPNRALPVLQKILAICPHNPYALYHFAKVSETMGEGERLLAQGLYEQLHGLQIPTWGDKRLYGYLAQLVPQLVEEGIWSQEKALRAIAFLVFQDLLAEARAIGDGIGRFPTEFELWIYQGDIWRQRGELKEAILMYQRALRIEPHSSDAWYRMGLIHDQQGRPDEALEAYERAIQLNAFSGREVGVSSAYRRIGLIYRLYEQVRDLDKAFAAHQAAIEADSFGSIEEKASSYFEKGIILRWMGGDPNEYITEYQKAIAIYPRYAPAHLFLGVAYYEKYRDIRMAEQEIQLAISMEPSNKLAYRYLGDIYVAEGKYEQATKMYERVLELDPEDRYVREVLRELQKPSPPEGSG